MSAELYQLIDGLRATANRRLAWAGNDQNRIVVQPIPPYNRRRLETER